MPLVSLFFPVLKTLYFTQYALTRKIRPDQVRIKYFAEQLGFGVKPRKVQTRSVDLTFNIYLAITSSTNCNVAVQTNIDDNKMI
jgi:hypothetical protein